MFSCVGRTIALASQHGKERVLARPLRQGLGLTLQLATTVNTDLLGSFSGEYPRPEDALTTCRLKAEAGMDALGLDLGLASEGAFGPHPVVPFLPIGREWLTFVDRRHQLTISEYALKEVGFPSHAVMVGSPSRVPPTSSVPPSVDWLAKGVHSREELARWMAIAAQRSEHGMAWLETDMRAHCNPTRMASIRRLAFQLVRRINASCPACDAPGWGLVRAIGGLPCSSCGSATELLAFEELGCIHCNYTELHPRQDQLLAADPGQCPYCNP
ncbi:MAG: hypothetical protein NTW02_04990 [Cyanobium sp. LacPavin_0920_WC12_MAG_62_9]|nr:hypothetical protein [Cyanobium sp. LacPavin_0920_WC12_MAG_62_9]